MGGGGLGVSSLPSSVNLVLRVQSSGPSCVLNADKAQRPLGGSARLAAKEQAGLGRERLPRYIQADGRATLGHFGHWAFGSWECESNGTGRIFGGKMQRERGSLCRCGLVVMGGRRPDWPHSVLGAARCRRRCEVALVGRLSFVVLSWRVLPAKA